jgi:DNA topoisomerase-3
VLGARDASPGYLEGNGYVVTWVAGHLLRLKEPHEYESRLKVWRLADLPIVPPQFELVPLSTQPQLKRVLQLLKSPAVDCVVNACDAGREGELIFRWLLEYSKSSLPSKRLWLSALTPGAVRDGFASLLPSADFDSLASAARCRAESDWLVGINATRAISKKCGGLLSVGRVQTPTLAMVVRREREVLSFVPETFFTVDALLRHDSGDFRAEWADDDGRQRRARTAEEAALVVNRLLERGVASVDDVQDKEVSSQPPLLYDLTDLQRDMNVRFGFPASKTLDLAQTLYERFKAITYPRTDSRYITGRAVPLVHSALSALAQERPDQVARLEELSGGKPPFGRLIRDSHVRDHHALLPTGRVPAVGGDLKRVYDAICSRLLASLFPPNIRRETIVGLSAGDDNLRTRGAITLQRGWREIIPGPEDSALPSMQPGDPVRVLSAEANEGVTKAPSRYTDATLLRAMQGAGKELDDESLKEALREKGIGTPATRAAIIERLIAVNYLFRDGKFLVPTQKGMAVIEAIPERRLVSAELTGDWEMKLGQVERGASSRDEFMREMSAFVLEVVTTIKGMEARSVVDHVGSCPRCGGDIIASSKAYKCRACGYAIFATVAGKSLSRKHVVSLLTKGRTTLISGFRSKSGGRFRAYLVLDEEKNVKFQFPKPGKKAAKKPAKIADGAASGKVSAGETPV